MTPPSSDTSQTTASNPPTTTPTPETTTTTTTSPDPDTQEVSQHFRPFVRHSAPWTTYEILKTIFTTIFLLPIRILTFILVCLLAYILSTLIILNHSNKPNSEFIILSTWRRTCIILLGYLLKLSAVICFGVYNIKIHKPPPTTTTPEPSYVLVANHLGWLDILILLSTYRSSFVAKGPIETTPLIGKVARAMQCLFVRPNESLTSTLIKRVQETYSCHKQRQSCPGCGSCLNPLIIFPEGTTTNGTSMVPFRTGVFNAGMPVKPVALKFSWKRWSPTWESVRFRTSLFRVMTQVRNYVEIWELDVYKPKGRECQDAALFAGNVQKKIQEVLEQEVVELNRKHKFVYHAFLKGEIGAKEALNKSRILSEEDQLLKKRREWAVQENV